MSGSEIKVDVVGLIIKGLQTFKTEGAEAALEDLQTAAEADDNTGLAAYLRDNLKVICECTAQRRRSVEMSTVASQALAGFDTFGDFTATTHDLMDPFKHAGKRLNNTTFIENIAREHIEEAAGLDHFKLALLRVRLKERYTSPNL